MMVLATIALLLGNPNSYRKLDSFHDFTSYSWFSFGAFFDQPDTVAAVESRGIEARLVPFELRVDHRAE